MNKITFDKYQGTGNDFIIIKGLKELDTKSIQQLCDRKFGIGADGLILMNQESALDFDMMYYNADGTSSFCGNGSRCCIMYAKAHGWIEDHCKFNSNDGEHEGIIEGETVFLKMHDVSHYDQNNGDFVISTGSPHYIQYQEHLSTFEVVERAKEIRYSETYKQDGINVNFIDPQEDGLHIRTYERGVEDETLSCGTGVTAAALAHYVKTGNVSEQYTQKVMTEGGELEVKFEKGSNGFSNIYLCGPAEFVFKGIISI